MYYNAHRLPEGWWLCLFPDRESLQPLLDEPQRWRPMLPPACLLGLGTLADWTLVETLSQVTELPRTRREEAPMSADLPALDAVVRAQVDRLLVQLRQQRRQVLRDADCETIHDLRVCLRRLRSLLDTSTLAAAGLTDPRSGRSLVGLARRAGRVRDLDVQIEAWTAELPGLTEGEARRLRRRVRALRQRRRQQLRRLQHRLDQPRLRRQLHSLRIWSHEAPGASLANPAPGWLQSSLAQVLEHPAHGLALTLATLPDPEQLEWLHDWRKRIKRLRYRAETLAQAGVSLPEGLMAELKQLQDDLGGLQDIRVWRAALAGKGDRRFPRLQQSWCDRERQHWQDLQIRVRDWSNGVGALPRLQALMLRSAGG